MPLLDGMQVGLSSADIIKPTTTQIISGAGLPLPKQPTRRGNIIVEFDIQFPNSLPLDVKQSLRHKLPSY